MIASGKICKMRKNLILIIMPLAIMHILYFIVWKSMIIMFYITFGNRVVNHFILLCVFAPPNLRVFFNLALLILSLKLMGNRMRVRARDRILLPISR